MNDTPIIGCSGFGILDSVSSPSEVLHSVDFCLSTALLPETPFGKVLVGEDAQAERTHTGIYWPPEARISRGTPVRRVPIPYAWRALVEARDRSVRWKTGPGVSFSVPRILASHVDGLLSRGRLRDINAPVVVIPNHLDEYGQDALLEALAKAGHNRATLIWRPVAAALPWLERVKQGRNNFPIGKDDHIHVLYFGPDAIEFTTLRLKEYLQNGENYVLPLRERPKDNFPISAMDWAGRVIEEAFYNPDDGAFLQAFTCFPEVWQALKGRSPKHDIVQPWNLAGNWDQWQLSPELPLSAWKTAVGTSGTLRAIYGESCPLQTSHDSHVNGDWEYLLKNELGTLSEAHPQGRLRGIIICGPLVPDKVSGLLETFGLEPTTAKFEHIQNQRAPQLDKIWISPGEKTLAQGAAIYGKMLAEQRPTYLDTMPQLSILAQARGRYQWVPLLKASEVMGGTEFKDSIKREFKLGRGARQLNVLLQKGDTELSIQSEGAETCGPDPVDFNVQSCKARLVREVIRGASSLESAIQLISPYQSSDLAEYALKYARFIFGEDEPPDAMDSLAELKEINQPFRKAVFNFPSSPDRDMPLDIAVCIKPASGLAQIEILPDNPSFLKGRRVYLDYSTMRPSSKLPKIQRGWPRVREIPVHPQDVILDFYRNVISSFENTPISSPYYKDIIDKIKNISTRTEPAHILGREIQAKAFDQNGFSCTNAGNELVKRIGEKYQSDFIEAANRKYIDEKQIAIIFVRASWLWAATPNALVDYLVDSIKNNNNKKRWQWAIESASRSFKTDYQFRLFYAEIENYYHSVTTNLNFPVSAARSICRLLMYRRDACLSLDRDKAYLFAQGALDRLIEEHNKGKYKETFFRNVMLLLYLLRVRVGDPGAFDPSSDEDLQPFLRAKELMDEAVKYAEQNHDYNRANGIKKVIIGLEKYLEYKGDERTITLLTNLTGEI